jgi:hypothetical protein
MTITTLPVFNKKELIIATDLLSAKVATMLGRKMEEADWEFVYCNTKKIPVTDWSNLHIDINHNGLGVEHKMLRVTKSGSILGECGTTKMHPAGTRSIRIPEEKDPNKAMEIILNQYSELIDNRTNKVKEQSSDGKADMRMGWLLWKDSLDEFLYFEEKMEKPDPLKFYATWNITPARGARKESKSLWIYEKSSDKKKFSVTTTAGAKIQPYFDVPSPTDPNLYHFKVQGVMTEGGLVKVWITKSTAKYLELLLGSLETKCISRAIEEFSPSEISSEEVEKIADSIASSVYITSSAYEKLKSLYNSISDEYMLQKFALQLGERS